MRGHPDETSLSGEDIYIYIYICVCACLPVHGYSFALTDYILHSTQIKITLNVSLGKLKQNYDGYTNGFPNVM